MPANFNFGNLLDDFDTKEPKKPSEKNGLSRELHELMRLDDQITENDLLNKREHVLSDTNKNLVIGSKKERIMKN